MKRAIIVGCGGQDGRILFEQLQARDYALIGIARDGIRALAAPNFSRVNILDPAAVEAIVREFQPDEIYYLAAFHRSSQGRISLSPRELFEKSYQIHVSGLINFLQAMAACCQQCRLFYAASSLVFGEAGTARQDEQTPLNPSCIYGITKSAGIQACRFYRRSESLYASVGILYNHESIHRAPDFVSQKIVRGAVSISRGPESKLGSKLVLGDLTVMVDWGWAPDFVRAMQQILDLPAADDFIVATGQAHSVEDFVREAFGRVGLDWTMHVEQNAAELTSRRGGLVGDSSKLSRLTGWAPSISFGDMVGKLLQGAREHLVKGIP